MSRFDCRNISDNLGPEVTLYSHDTARTSWVRTRVDGIIATQAWCGWGVLAHNATKVSALLVAGEKGIAPVAQAALKRSANLGLGPPRRRADTPAT